MQQSPVANIDTCTGSNSSNADTIGTNQSNRSIQYDENECNDKQPINYEEYELVIDNNSGLTTYPLQPKHIRFPDVPYSSELINELMIFVYTIIATAMQFLHLYRTVWWLPESNTNQTMVRTIPFTCQLLYTKLISIQK